MNPSATDQIMTSSLPGSHRMTLRSRCDGSCGSSLDVSPDPSYSGPRRTPLLSPHSRHHNDHHHHSHHIRNSHRILDDLRAEETLRVTDSPLLAVRLTRIKDSGNQRALLSAGRSAVSHLSTVTRSVYTEETVLSSARKTTAGHSDYSSADEELAVELNGSWTSSSRQLNGGSAAISSRLDRRSAMSDSSDDDISSTGNKRNARFASTVASASVRAVNQSARTSALDERWARTSTVSRSARLRNGRTSFGGRWPTPIEDRTSLVHLYGLDEDLDEEMVDVLNMDAVRKQRLHFALRQNVFGYLESAWWTFWRFLYWVIGSAMLLDTLFVIRGREFIQSDHSKARKYFVPLLLLLFLLGGSSLLAADQNGVTSSAVQCIANVPHVSLSYLYALLNFSSTVSETAEASVKTEAPADWSGPGRTDFWLQQMIMQIYGHPEEDRTPLHSEAKQDAEAKLDAAIWDAVQRRMAELGFEAPGPGDGGAALEAEFVKLKAQVEASERSVGKYQSDYQAIRAQVNQYHKAASLKTQQGEQRVLQLEQKLLELQQKLQGLQEQLLLQDHRHELLLANMRNCCRNHSEYAAFVKDHVVVALNALPDAPGAETCERLAPFQKWLKSYFTTKEDLQQQVSFLAEAARGAAEPDDERVARLLLANKAAIAAIVEERLRSQTAAPAKVAVGPDSGVTEEQLKALIHRQIALYNADRLGLPDFALESSGGSVVSTRCSESFLVKTAQYSILGIGLWYVSNSPRTVIQPGVNPGECWAFKGSQGYLVIKLSRRIKVTAFSLEHIPRIISPSGSIDTAPKEFQVLGLEDEATPGVELGKFLYDQEGEPLQYFIVKDPDEPPIFQLVELRILSNHGNPEYTCLYRFRVHGDLARP